MTTAVIDTLPRDTMLRVAHEYMLSGMLSNQATLPQTIVAGGSPADLDDVAIDLWMGASPVYTRRMRRLMGIEGDDVPAIMKTLQLDVGFVHQYMQVRYQVNDPWHGEFWLEHCGALLNVEPHGEERVLGMCHTIEDPTFDATAYATNPRARIRPIHRPPRVPPGRVPHCHWTITIDPANEPVGPARLTQQVAALPLASLSLEPRADGYQRAFDPGFRLRDLSDGTLAAVTREFAVQTHLLMCSGEIALAERFGVARARDLIGDAWLATAWVATERLVDALGDRADVATVLAVHPAIPPGFARVIDAAADGSYVRMTLEPETPALLEPAQPGWVGALARGDRRGIEGVVHPVERRARVSRVTVGDGRVAVEVKLDPVAEPVREPDVVAFMRVGMLHTWRFRV